MNIIPWKTKREDRALSRPDHSLNRLRHEMDDLFERFFRDPFLSPEFETELAWGPRIDLAETDSDVTVTAELPGVDPKEVEIKVVDNMLTISGEKRQNREEKKLNYHFVERRHGSFHRAIALPSSVNPDKVEANFRNGVLTVVLTKHPNAQARRIEIKQG